MSQAGLSRPLRGLPLERVSLSSSVPPIIALAGLYLAAREAGFPIDKLRGSVLQVPLYSEDCSYAMHMPVELPRAPVARLDGVLRATMPRFHSFVEDTYFFSEAGLTPVEEMALGFVEIRHLDRESAHRARRTGRLLRAAHRHPRQLRHGLLRGGRQDPRHPTPVRPHDARRIRRPRPAFAVGRDHGHTSGLSLTAQQPANNVVRGTVQAMALSLAGVQAIEVSAFDEAYRTPSREAHLVGLRTQQILEIETGDGQGVDPLGGAYFVEALTDEIETRILEMVTTIEAQGDPVKLRRRRLLRRSSSVMERATARSTGERQIVGVNMHRVPAEEDRCCARSRNEDQPSVDRASEAIRVQTRARQRRGD